MKGREYADGRNQHNWLSKWYISLSTVSAEGLMLSCMIDAMEVWGVATDKVPGYFLQNDYDKGDIHIKSKGEMVILI